ncbi:hypothetical protein [Streptomyces prunicolor]|uniref:hypothetical protein n=1 Tax=Streptomyces prunicolor TaxID=67348 RepID=UPI000381BE3E|nr:hypothetical protein [Streptomyces prunicolor]
MAIRTHYKEADIRRLLEAGMNNTQIARQLRITRETAAQVREELGYPPPPRSIPPTSRDKFTAATVEVAGGHMVWTGERTQDCAPVLSHSGTKLSVRPIAYEIQHGRKPVGRVKAACVYAWCVAPEHQADTVDRDRTRTQPRQLDAAAALLGAN